VRKQFSSIMAVLALSGVAAACSAGGASPTPPATNSAPSTNVPTQATPATTAITGTIDVLTNRTDIVDSVFTAQYVPAFNKIYPNIQVKFEALKDYEGDTKIRMNTTQYGDVLLIPNAIHPDQLASYFTPLGQTADLSKTYRLATEQSFGGVTYGLPITINANGFVYNKKVWSAAGITTLPKSPDEFLADLQTIKTADAGKNGFISPYYTNYHDGWPTTQWQGNAGEISGSADFNNSLYKTDAPWTAGNDEYTIYKLLYDIVHNGLAERDPTTTDWETSKGLLGSGKIATMALGSWAIVQMQQAAVTAGGSAADIGYMPFPNQVNGKFYSNIGGDYKIAINKNSPNQAAARAWLDWFENSSNYAFDQGGVSPLLTGKNPSQLSDFTAADVQYIQQTPAPAGDQAFLGQIQDASGVQLYDTKWPQQIIDAARGATHDTLDSIFAGLNAKWKAARATVKAPNS
jgi:raffinose/stachyose/melibiose transport system substrate-binding protein